MKPVKFVINVFTFISVAAIISMLVITFVDVTGRLIFVKPVVGATEYCEMLMVVMLTAMGGALLAGKTVQVDVLLDMMPKRTALVVDTAVLSVAILFCVLVAYGTYLNGQFAMKVNRIYTFLQVPHWPFLMLLAFSFLVAGVATFLYIIVLYQNKDKGKEKNILDHADLTILEDTDQ